MQAASGLGRAGLWEAKSGKEHGKLVFAPETAQLQAPFHPCNPQRLPGPDPTDRLVVPGKGSSALTPCPPPPRRCPHGAGLVRQAHRLRHQAGEPCGPLLSSSGGGGLPHLSPNFPYPSRNVVSDFTCPSTSTHTLSTLEKFFPLSRLSCFFLAGEDAGGEGRQAKR